MKITMELGEQSYDILLQRGCIDHIKEYINVDRKVMVISDNGVPKEYIDRIMKQCPQGYYHVVKQGEVSKSLPVFNELCEVLLENHFSRKDLVIALGGGVVGDLSGYVAASYMRGIDFVQVPTTTLSQIDSSIGGKVAINLDQVKNVIGAFYQPKMIFIDPDTLATLPRRHYMNGLMEALKEGLIYDEQLFELFEQGDVDKDIEAIIAKALLVKKDVVEQDEKEMGLRKILNFGHTIGHAIETSYHLRDYYHGECVALGMLFFLPDDVLKQRVINVYKRLGIPDHVDYDPDQILAFMKNDKKANGNSVDVIIVKTCGKATIESLTFDDIAKILRGNI